MNVSVTCYYYVLTNWNLSKHVLHDSRIFLLTNTCISYDSTNWNSLNHAFPTSRKKSLTGTGISYVPTDWNLSNVFPTSRKISKTDTRHSNVPTNWNLSKRGHKTCVCRPIIFYGTYSIHNTLFLNVGTHEMHVSVNEIFSRRKKYMFLYISICREKRNESVGQ